MTDAAPVDIPKLGAVIGSLIMKDGPETLEAIKNKDIPVLVSVVEDVLLMLGAIDPRFLTAETAVALFYGVAKMAYTTGAPAQPGTPANVAQQSEQGE